ncbi:exocyst complex component Sec10-like protein [Suillus plorans]|uniref:Exocyst complex component Sec10-like protein n=1 Tax=Suillus plorans TaxID=116603 RepID=A0A9P7J7F0_9AGAM|nr:exocyst complex component Sec10-like protein [Suillus plorans]KAG1806615.1 exocyst complex component Sec10-like protein [Suillus plorans]
MQHFGDLDSATEEQLRLNNFEGKFDVKEFVGSISERLITQSKASSGPFDPKPFIRTFEAVVDKLISVRKDVQAKTEQMEKSVRVAEREYSKKMADLNRGFEAVGSSFSTMESKMNEVGRTAVRIGEQLESIHIERQRAQAAHDLINYYNQFSRGDTSRLDALKKEGREGRSQVAIILRRLTTVAREVDLPSADKTRENIDKYCEKFEKDMIYLFDRCYRKGDPKLMHHCAQTLLDFNGGASCVQIYVNQHDFFMNKVRDTANHSDDLLWNNVSKPDESPPKTESGLTELFGEIRATVAQESQIVQAVFPNPPFVMQVFLQRVFAQSIQQYMEQLLTKGSSLSDLAYLRILQLVHNQTSNLVEDLKAHELPSITPSKSSLEISEFRRVLSGALTVSGTSTTSVVSAMLENAMAELFVPYIEGQKYLDRESKSLGELYAGLLANYTRYHMRMQKVKSSMFDRMVDRLGAAAANTTTSGGSSTSAQAAALIMRYGGISSERIQDKSSEDNVREEDGLLSIDVAEKMLKWHAEAVGRCVELTSQNDVPKNTFILLRVLAEAIGAAYLETAIESAIARLEFADPKLEPSLQPLEVLRSVDLICHLWQQYTNMALFPLAASSVTVRREMTIFNNQTVSRTEGAANTLIQRTIDATITWLSLQLSKQKKNDFKPRNDDLSFARVNTEPCVACCEILEKVRDAAIQNISGKNREAFLTEIGVSFHSLLLDHLRKYPVSATGGLMLAKDLKSYQDTVASFNIPALHERFEFIRQLGNVFLVRPEILKSYITENYLGRIDSALLKPYLAQRSDWGQFETRFNENVDVEDVATDSASKGLKDRFKMAKLGTMVKDLEGLKLGDGISMGIPSGFTGSFSIGGRGLNNNSA